MTDFAVLGFRADTSPLKQAEGSLDGVARAGKRASDKIVQFGRSAKLGGDQAATGMDKAKRASDGLGRSTGFVGSAVAAAKARLLGMATGADAAAASAMRLKTAVDLLRVALGFVGIAMTSAVLINYADTWSDLSARVGLAVGDMDMAPEVMARIESMARRTYSSLTLTAESFVANSTSLRELGLNTAQQLDYTEALNLAMVVSGAKAERAAMVQNALSRAMALGVLRGDELNTVIQSGGRVAELLAEKLGTTVSGLRKLGAEGKITTDIVYTSLVGAMGTLIDEAERMPATIGDAFQIVGNRLQALVGGFDQYAGASEMVAIAIIAVADNFDILIAAAGGLATVMAGKLVVSLVAGLIPALVSLGTQAVLASASLAGMSATQIAMTVATKGLTAAFRGLFAAISVLGIPLLIAGVSTLIYGFMKLVSAVGSVGNAFALVKAVASDVFGAISNAILGAMATTRAWGNAFDAWAYGVSAAIVETVIPKVNNLIGAFVGAKDAIAAAWGMIPAIMRDIVAKAVNWVIGGTADMINVVIGGINDLASGLANSKFGKLIGMDGSGGIIKEVNFDQYKMEVTGAASATGTLAQEAYDAAQGVEYVSGAMGEYYRMSQAGYKSMEERNHALAASHYESAKAGLVSVGALKDLVTQTDENASSAADLATQLNTAGDAATKAGDKGKKASDKAKKGLRDTKDAVGQLSEEMRKNLTSAIESVSNAWGDFVVRGFQDFKGFVGSVLDAFKRMLSQMIAMAAKNRIMISMGIDPLSVALSKAGVPGVGGAGAGLLGSALGSFGAPAAGGLLGGLGGVWAGVSSGWASGGLMGALGGGLSASISGISGGLAMGGLAGITSAIGAAIPIIGAVAAVVSIGKKLFGRKLKDTGIQATFDMAQGIAGRTYEFYKGGLFRSNKTKYKAMAKDVADPLGEMFTAVGTSVLEAAHALGFEGATLDGLKFSFKFSTKGMSEEKIQEKFQEELEKYGNAAAKAIIENIGEYLESGESEFEALTRLASSLTTANKAFDMLGRSLYEVGLAGAVMASDLADMFGGLENMSASIQNYFSKFYSEDEQRDYVERTVRDTLAGLELAMPNTRDEFRSLVDSLDLTTESGREAFAVLVSLTDAIDTLYPLTNDLANAWADVSKSLRETMKVIRLDATSGLERLMEAERQYNALRRSALEGDIEAARGVGKAATDYLSVARSMSSSAVDYARRAARVNSQLGEVADFADTQATPEAALAAAIENSTKNNVAVPTSELKVANEELKEEVKELKQVMAAMFEVLVQGTAAQSAYSRKIADMLRKWDVDGSPAERTEDAA